MAKLLKLRRGTTSQHSSFTGAEGEVTVDTDKETLVVHDGSTAGGHPVAAEDMANVSSASIAGRLGTDSIATSKIAAGALPTDVTIDTANITADAVDGTKLADNACNSEHYTDGSIDHVHLAADCVDGDNIADDSINSEHIVADSIDTEHYAPNSVNDTALSHTGVSASSYGSSTAIPQITVNEQGRITSAGTATVNTTTNLATTTASGSVTITSSTGNNATISEATSSAAGVMSTTHHDKLDGIESGATADQSASEILTAIKTVDGSGSGLDADTVDGYNVSTSSSNSTLVGRNSSGYIFGNYLNMTGTFSNSGNTSGMATFTGTNGGDNYGRSYTAAAARSLLNVADGATNNGSGSLSSYLPLTGGTLTGTLNARTILPTANNNYNLGSDSARWANLYTNDLHLSNEGHSNDVDGTWGNWTIQEGESDLFLKNNRSGKTYKFNLTEIS